MSGRVHVKPITGQRLPLAVKAEELLFEQLPFHKWEAQQNAKRKKMKF